MKAVQQAGQEIQVTVDLLDPLHKLPNIYPDGFLQAVADVVSFDLSGIDAENCSKCNLTHSTKESRDLP